jgi:branched-chain amino acid transport system substrate-binding protein
MSNTTKWIIGVIILALVVWGVLSQRQSKNQTVEKPEVKTELPEVIKLGAIQGLTGDTANIGEVFKNVLQMAVDELNQQGGISGKPVQLILEDGKCNGKDASAAAQKLVNVDKVQFIIGGLCSGESLAAEPIVTAGKVVLASGSATNPKLAGISPYFFRLAPNDNAQGQIDAEMANKKGYKKVAVLTEQTEYATGILKAFKDSFEKLGGVVESEEFAPGTANFSTQITKLKNTKPDALFLNTNGSTSFAKILKQMTDQNWKPQLMLNEIVSTDIKFLTDNKAQMEGALGVEFKTDETNPKLKTLVENYKKRFNTDISFVGFSAANYDLVSLFAEGVKTVGYNGEALAKWSRTIKNWPGALGKVSIKPDGDNESSYSASVIKDGKLVPIIE